MMERPHCGNFSCIVLTETPARPISYILALIMMGTSLRVVLDCLEVRGGGMMG